MDEKLQLQIRWPDGAILPIITQRSWFTCDVINMLRFACGPNQQMEIFYNDHKLDPDVSLMNYGITDGDTLQAFIKTKQPDQQRIIDCIGNITREAAKISDIHMNRMEDQSGYYSVGMIEEETTMFGPVNRTVIPPKEDQMNTTPLPSPWAEQCAQQEGCDDDNLQVEQPRFSTREEAKALFSADGRDRWMW